MTPEERREVDDGLVRFINHQLGNQDIYLQNQPEQWPSRLVRIQQLVDRCGSGLDPGCPLATAELQELDCLLHTYDPPRGNRFQVVVELDRTSRMDEALQLRYVAVLVPLPKAELPKEGVKVPTGSQRWIFPHASYQLTEEELLLWEVHRQSLRDFFLPLGEPQWRWPRNRVIRLGQLNSVVKYASLLTINWFWINPAYLELPTTGGS